MGPRPAIAVRILVAAAMMAGGCASTRSVALRVTDAEGAPVPGATISAVPLKSSMVPLPVTSETLGEVLAADRERRFAVADRTGTVRLQLLDRPHLVVLSAPALGHPDGEEAQARAWRFLLDPGANELAPDGEPGSGPEPGLRLDLDDTSR